MKGIYKVAEKEMVWERSEKLTQLILEQHGLLGFFSLDGCNTFDPCNSVDHCSSVAPCISIDPRSSNPHCSRINCKLEPDIEFGFDSVNSKWLSEMSCLFRLVG